MKILNCVINSLVLRSATSNGFQSCSSGYEFISYFRIWFSLFFAKSRRRIYFVWIQTNIIGGWVWFMIYELLKVNFLSATLLRIKSDTSTILRLPWHLFIMKYCVIYTSHFELLHYNLSELGCIWPIRFYQQPVI